MYLLLRSRIPFFFYSLSVIGSRAAIGSGSSLVNEDNYSSRTRQWLGKTDASSVARLLSAPALLHPPGMVQVPSASQSLNWKSEYAVLVYERPFS